MSKYKYTRNCVRCGKPAKGHSGHVLRGKEKIIAGWCSNRCRKNPGFVGRYQTSMKIILED